MTWAHYILQVNIYLVVFYGFYKLLLDKETYFLLNRIYLVAAGVLSLAIPFLRFEWFTTQPAVQPVYTGVVQINDLITQMAVVKDAPERFNLGNTVVFIYLAGMLFFVIRFIVQLISVQILLKTKKRGAAFSFFKKKVVDQDLPEVQTIQKHEEIHIRQWHTLDVLFFEVLGIIAWFNPIIYLYKTTIKHIHEYLADEEAASFQGDKEQYALLLLSSAFGIPANTLTNSFFNKSLIKKRIYMLHKQRSRKTAILKYGMFVPLFAVTLIMSSATIRNNEEIKKVAEVIPLEQPLKVVKEVVTDAIHTNADKVETTKVVVQPTITSKTAENKADTVWADFYKHLKKSLRYSPSAQEKNIQGNSQVRFIVKDGKVEEINTVTALGYGCDEELKRCISTYSNFKNIPDGNYTINTQFRLSYDVAPSTPVEFKNQNLPALKDYVALSEIVVVGYGGKSSSSNSGDSKVYDFVSLEQQPSFPGGMEQFYVYLRKSIKYPKEAFEKKIEGKVFLSFIVETDGELSDIQVNRKVGGGTDEEAVRVLEESPKWIPGVQDGKKVRVKYNIPIDFSLNKTAPNLQGKTPGIQINGDKLIIGNSNPTVLYIIDGVKQKVTNLASLNPNDIASVEVLKDKSATTRYGEEGKDGVIIITTKIKEALDLKKKETKDKKN